MDEKKIKKPMSKQSIYRLMQILVYIVAPIYLIKNIAGGVPSGAVTIGICLVVFAGAILLMKRMQAADDIQYLVASIGLVFLVFLISLNSGEYYSDDYSLYITVMGVSGLFMDPRITKVQGFLIPVLLILQYLIHPEKVESRSQFIMCLAIFCLAAYVMYLLVNRGRAFIEISENRADDAEKLMNSMKDVGEELQKNIQNTAVRYEELNEVNSQLVEEVSGLRRGSDGIMQGTLAVADVCDDAHGKLRTTEQQIEVLNTEVGSCETAIVESRAGLNEMNEQMGSVQNAMDATNKVFSNLKQQMKEISEVIEELNKIASNTTMLALNASIEAARAGQSGAGFAVVASKVQNLAIDSTDCSKRVEVVLKAMQAQIEETTFQLEESTSAISGSLHSLGDLEARFDSLTDRFENLYRNIDDQNENIQGVDQIFTELKDRIYGMNGYSEENQAAVDSISAAMDKCIENMKLVIADSKRVSEVSENMLQMTIE